MEVNLSAFRSHGIVAALVQEIWIGLNPEISPEASNHLFSVTARCILAPLADTAVPKKLALLFGGGSGCDWESLDRSRKIFFLPPHKPLDCYAVV